MLGETDDMRVNSCRKNSPATKKKKKKGLIGILDELKLCELVKSQKKKSYKNIYPSETEECWAGARLSCVCINFRGDAWKLVMSVFLLSEILWHLKGSIYC